jgi:hypothetical protein
MNEDLDKKMCFYAASILGLLEFFNKKNLTDAQSLTLMKFYWCLIFREIEPNLQAECAVLAAAFSESIEMCESSINVDPNDFVGECEELLKDILTIVRRVMEQVRLS